MSGDRNDPGPKRSGNKIPGAETSGKRNVPSRKLRRLMCPGAKMTKVRNVLMHMDLGRTEFSRDRKIKIAKFTGRNDLGPKKHGTENYQFAISGLKMSWAIMALDRNVRAETEIFRGFNDPGTKCLEAKTSGTKMSRGQTTSDRNIPILKCSRTAMSRAEMILDNNNNTWN